MSHATILVSVGNTRTRVALAHAETLEPSRVADNNDPDRLAEQVLALLEQAGAPGTDAPHPDSDAPRIVIASVNPRHTAEIERAIAARIPGAEVLRFGRDIPIPVRTSLSDESTVGQDRLLCALGAFWRSKQACIVVDAGTAITVDFVDGEGVFHGGAIAPGLAMMARALHEHTAQLPLVDVPAQWARLCAQPESLRREIEDGTSGPAPFGKDTAQAIALGVVSSARGLTRHLIDRYAEFYGAYPRVVATGGDAPLLFEHDDLVEAIVPDLTLIGMHSALGILAELEDRELDA